MDKAQQDKWNAKVDQAKGKKTAKKDSSTKSDMKKTNPDINKINQKYKPASHTTKSKKINLKPDLAVEKDIKVDVQAFKGLDNTDDQGAVSDNKVIIRSKKGGTLGFEG